MGSKIHERIAPGIYRLVSGSFRVKVGLGEMARGGRQRETAFPSGTSLREMKTWQTTTRAALLREDIRPAKGTLAADIDGYVERVRGRMPSWKARRSDLKSWVPRFGNRLRHTITPAEVDDQLKTWKAAGVAIWSCNHRRTALAMLYKELDGETAHNPAAKTKRFAPPLAIPQALDYEVIERVLGRIESCVTKAMLGIMAYCGFRPSEIRRAHRENVLPFIGAEQPFVQRLTSKKGRPVALPVPAQGVTYWRMFDEFNGWGRSVPNINRDWKAAMRREQGRLTQAATNATTSEEARSLLDDAARFEPVKCYALVHSYCTHLLNAGTDDLSLVQEARGHRDIRTTQIYTVMKVNPRLFRAVEKAFKRNS